MTPDEIIHALAELRSAHAFNPYADACPQIDLPGAAQIRRENLLKVLTAAAARGVDEMWIALEPSQKGARRTGLAMTDVARLSEHGARFGVADLQVATCPTAAKGKRHPREGTASAVWSLLDDLPERVFLWNTVALYTHQPGQPLRNRPHTAAERHDCAAINRAMIELLSPGRLVAIGKPAGKALENEGFPVTTIRHPANGGTRSFREQVRAIDRG